jgi:P22 coat protein - gene protein 5
MAGILTPTQVTREAARLFYNNLAFTKGVNRQYDDSFTIGGAKVGDTINMRLPQRYTVTSGPNLSAQTQDEYSRSLQLNTQKHVDVSFTSKELTLQLQDFSDRVLAPAMAQLANEVDVDGLQMAKIRTYNSVGTPGVVPNALLTYALAGAYMSDESTPRDAMRSMVLEPISMATIIDTLKGLFQQSDEIGQQYMTGLMGRALGFKWAEDQNIPSHTVGPLGGSPQVAGANQGLLTGWADFTDLLTSGWTAAAAVRLNQGDLIEIGGVFGVNPLSRASFGRLRRFVVESTVGGNVSSDGSGNATIRIRPAIIAGGQYQNVTARPANLAPITVIGTANTTGRRNIAYHRDAFVLGMADLEMPDGVDWKARVSVPELGFSIRAVRQYTINTDAYPARFDLLYGWATLLPEMAALILA